MAIPLYIFTNKMWPFQLFHMLTNTWYFLFFHFSHCDRYIVVPDLSWDGSEVRTTKTTITAAIYNPTQQSNINTIMCWEKIRDSMFSTEATTLPVRPVTPTRDSCQSWLVSFEEGYTIWGVTPAQFWKTDYKEPLTTHLSPYSPQHFLGLSLVPHYWHFFISS